MISDLILEFLTSLLIFLLLRSLLRSFFAGFRRSQPRPAPKPPAPPPVRAGGVLHRDPVCGTYVSDDSAIALNIRGEMVYFCSAECRAKYR